MANDRRAILALGVLVCWLGLASLAAAQSMLYGVVSYPTGQVAANVTIVAEKEDTGERWDTRTSSLGTYTFYRLPNGTYTIRVNTSQMSFLAAGVEVRPRQKTALDIPLCMCREEVITVRGRSALPRRHSDGSGGAVFSREAIDNMSLTNGPNLQSIIGAVPGINFTETFGTLAQFSAIGQPRFANRTYVDGIGVDLGVDVLGLGVGQVGGGTLPAYAITGSTQTLIPFSAIEEIEIRTTNASSEYARTPGAQTTIVTRSGSDRFRAEAFTHGRPEAIRASDWFINAGQRPERRSRYWDMGTSAGGPLLPRRIVYYGTWEYQSIDRSVEAKTNVPSMSARNATIEDQGDPTTAALLNAFPVPNGSTLSGEPRAAEYSRIFPALQRLSTLSVRLDSNLSDRHRSFIRVNRGDSKGDSLDDTLLPSFTFTNTETTATTTIAGGLNSVWSSATHEFRFGVNRHRGTLTASPYGSSNSPSLPMASLIAPGVSAQDAWMQVVVLEPSMTIQSGRYASNAQESKQISDTWSVLSGRHEWRLGFEYQNGVASADGADNRYVYRFLSLEELLEGRLLLLLIDRALPARARKHAWAVFVQDSFRVAPRLSLDYGVRYGVRPSPSDHSLASPLLLDYESLPVPKPASDSSLWRTSWTDIAPRVVATYQLDTDSGRETTLRAGWSLAFDERVSSGFRAFGGGYPYTSTNAHRDGSFPATPSDLVWSPPQVQFGSDDVSNYFAFPTDLKAPRTHEWQVALDRAFGRVHQVSAGYVGTAGRDLIYPFVYDLGMPTVYAYSNNGRSSYHALLLDVARRRSRGIQARLSYTWSHAIDFDSGENRRPNPPPSIISPESNQASADFDRRHMLRVTASYAAPRLPLPRLLADVFEDWQFDVLGLLQSGTPVSIGAIRPFAGGAYEIRPNMVDQQPVWIGDPKSPTGWRINQAAFAFRPNAQGTLGRNTFRGSILRQVDLKVTRSIRLKRVVAQLEVDALNVLNIPNFAPPVGDVFETNFGRPDRTYAEGLGTGSLYRGGLVPIHQIGGPRSIQVGLRLTY